MKQSQALEIMHSGVNVFLTGAPGAGKTYTLQKFIEQAEDKGKRVAVTASTGIAASHIGGTTIHSFSGIGIADQLSDADIDRLTYNKQLVKRYKKTTILVIDEVSMISADMLDLLDRVAQKMRNNTAAFGGIQVILIGDLFQLPPISRNRQVDMVYASNAWKRLELQICYLTEQHRQAEEDALLHILKEMRKGTITPQHVNALNTRAKQTSDETITHLYAHNVDVDSINTKRLYELQGKSKTFIMNTSGQDKNVEKLKRGLLVPEKLELRVGAEVMFVANNFQAGFFNGTRGTVIGFKKKVRWPIVKLKTGRKIIVSEHSWDLKEEGEIISTVEQIPLRLAWAITIHKSQGMSLDAALIDLSKAFTPGMGYVALSRVRSLDGLYFKGANDMAFRMHDEVFAVDKLLYAKSEQNTNINN